MRSQPDNIFILSLLILFLSGCTGVYSLNDADIRGEGNVVAIQYVKQLETFSCGAASLEMVSRYWEKPIKQEDLIFSASDTIKKTGFSIGDIKTHALDNGFKAVTFKGTRKLLENQIAKGRPVIVALSLPYNRSVQNPFLRQFPASKGAAFFMDSYSHFVVVVGITTQDIIVMDPLTGIDTYSYIEFDKHWQDESYAALLLST